MEDDLTKCEVCMSHPDKQQKEPLLQQDLPERPWQIIATDIFTVRGRDYLCTVDYFSSFFEVDKLLGKTARDVISVLRRNFARYGIPEVVISEVS